MLGEPTAGRIASWLPRTLLFAALALATTATGQTAVPPELQDLAARMSARLDAFDARLATEWDGSRHAVIPSATLLLDGLLRPFGLSNGYARVTRLAGSSSFVAYGVVNDGESPGAGRTNDGSFVSMSAY